jgi:transcriptional regulator with GAF, ATPase, and Fis domain
MDTGAGRPIETLESAGSQLALLHRISGIVSSSLTLKEMLDELIGLVVSVTSCDACLVYLLDESAGEIVLCASQLPHAPEIGNIRMKIGEGVTGWVAQHRSVVALSSQASSDPRFKAFRSLPEDTYEAFLSVPLITSGEVISGLAGEKLSTALADTPTYRRGGGASHLPSRTNGRRHHQGSAARPVAGGNAESRIARSARRNDQQRRLSGSDSSGDL